MDMQTTPSHTTGGDKYKPVPYQLPAIIESVLINLGYTRGEENDIYKSWLRGTEVLRFYTFLPQRMDIRLCEITKVRTELKPDDRMIITVRKDIDVNQLAPLLMIMSGMEVDAATADVKQRGQLVVNEMGNIGFS
jgi:hypothetical protein